MAFVEQPRFPDHLAFWMEGGGGFQTTSVTTYGGNEYRNRDWSLQKGVWRVKGEALLTTSPAYASFRNELYFIPLRNLFKVSFGQWGGFRFKDFRDYQDEGAGVLGATGLAVTSTLAYQMYKNYAISPAAYQQKVQKPIASTIKIYNNGVLQTLTTDYTLNAATGVVTFTSQPTVGHALTWTGEYDMPVRFGDDTPMIGPDSTGAMYDWAGLSLVELRNL